MKRIVIALAATMLCSTNVAAFEVATHGLLTKRAWERLLQEDPNVLTRLGIKDEQNFFGTDLYLDYRPADAGGPAIRTVNPFEERIIGAIDLPQAAPPFLARLCAREPLVPQRQSG